MPARRKPAAAPLGPSPVRTPADVGLLVREARLRQDTDQATAAGLSGVGIRFLSELERGKPNVRLGLALQVLQRFGLEIWIGPRGSFPRRP